jgi:ABC-type Na+ transport system ATPase subunit NatA
VPAWTRRPIVWLRGFLERIADEGRMGLVSSHALSDVHHIADRVVIIEKTG